MGHNSCRAWSCAGQCSTRCSAVSSAPLQCGQVAESRRPTCSYRDGITEGLGCCVHQGVPVLIELGPRDVSKGVFVMVQGVLVRIELGPVMSVKVYL